MKYLFLAPLAFLIACFSRTPENTGLEGKSLPEFSLLLSDSTTYLNTKSIPTGRPSVFFFFSPHCPYCKSQMAGIVKDIENLKGLDIYAITSFSYGEMKAFEKGFALDQYPNIRIGRDTAAFFAQYLDVKGVPYTALYNKEKRLSRAFSGQVSTSLLKELIAE